ncbi:SPARC [Cordylochernes scorpioides]|uniref:SPARC n=1 Tax=Cordylochernes scorpioides TaxID=51811 RepID=A0ABY6L2F7_9ARAC|nr:SPARC [Cordylochernes scorpioides]
MCGKNRCGPGRTCMVKDDGELYCGCVTECRPERDERRKHVCVQVCSKHNETWPSDCELYKMRCECVEEMDSCAHVKYKHAHVDYYGACRDIPECLDEEMEDFPRRMREWLFNIMKDLATRKELEDPYVELIPGEKDEESFSRRWVNAVIWKFCDLDTAPHDRAVSRHELFPIRAPLQAMEHCIAPFLNKCDANDDHRITLEEWGLCLGLKPGTLFSLSLCTHIRHF